MWWCGETGERLYNDASLFEIDRGHQVLDQWDLDALLTNQKTVLSGPEHHVNHFAEKVAVDGDHVQPNQVFGPILPLVEIATPRCVDIRSPDLLGGAPIYDPLESDLRALVAETNRPNDMRAILNDDDGADGEVDEILLVYVKTQMAVEPMGSTQSSDSGSLGISRRTRRQR
jgi:hypothetical protein